MTTSGKRLQLLASSALFGLAASAGSTAIAVAQDNAEGDTIIVTGSRIPQTNLTSVSPVTQINSEEIALQGVQRVEDLINKLPQAFAVQNSTIVNGASGTANVNLRNLGPVRTLVLINGQRMQAGTPNSGTSPAPDLNFIPAAMVERVEILTGGASATYGSDALAGVVNFILKDEFEGLSIDANYSFYQHDNNDDVYRQKHAAAGYPSPEGSVIDGFAVDVTALLGASSPDGRGNVTGYFTYRDIDSVSQADRDISACALGSTITSACGGSSSTPWGTFRSDFAINGEPNYGPGFTASDSDSDGVPDNFVFQLLGDQFTSYYGSYNYGPLNYFQRPDTRYQAGLFGHYEVTSGVEAYGSFMFMDDRTDAQIAESATFYNSFPPGTDPLISCSNPLLSAQQVQSICTDYGLGPTDSQKVYIGRRNVEGGPRDDMLRHTAYRYTAGIRGDLSDNWSYDISALYANTHFAQNYRNEVLISRFINALDVIVPTTGPLAGTPSCRVAVATADGGTGTDSNCVPYDIFTQGNVTDAALNYITGNGHSDGNTSQQVVTAALTGDLGAWGGQFPAAEEPIAVALGTEYRRETLELRTDIAFAPYGEQSILSDLSGQGSPTIGTNGGYDVYEFFGEARVPVIQGRPGFENLTFDLGYRYSDYSTGQSTDTYKLGGEWAPMPDFTLRAAYQRAARAPNVNELFSPARVALFGGTDPCSSSVVGIYSSVSASSAACALTGVTASQYAAGGVAFNPAFQYNQFIGGNVNLKPETSDTVTIGAVVTPTALPGFSATIDWFNIKVEDLIGTVGAQTILNACLLNGNSSFCPQVVRVGGSLWSSPLAGVQNPTINTGSLETAGVDVQVNYAFDLGANGGIRTEIAGTYLDKLTIVPISGDPTTYLCAGKLGPNCSGFGQNFAVGNPEWRHRARITWDTPWNASISGAWRYIGEVTEQRAGQAGIDAISYFDLAGSWNVFENTTLRAGVNNVLDEDPPFISSAFSTNGNTDPGTYDSIGRYIFFGATVDF